MWEDIEILIRTKKNINYSEVIGNIKDIFDFYKQKYYYIHFKDEVLVKLIYMAVKDNINKEFMIPQVYAQVEMKIERFIRDKLRKKDITMIEIMLKDIAIKDGNNKLKAIRDFYKLYNRYGISFNEEYFLFVKDNSKLFKKMLLVWGIEDVNYKDFKNIISHNYDFYFKVKPPFKSFNWTLETFSYINFLLDKKINFLEASNEEVLKIRYIMANDKMIFIIKRIYCCYFYIENEKELDRLIYNLESKSMKKLIEDYKVYSTFLDKEKMPEFILKLYLKLRERNVNTYINWDKEKTKYLLDNMNILINISELYKNNFLVSIDKELGNIELRVLKKWVRYYNEKIINEHLEELFKDFKEIKKGNSQEDMKRVLKKDM